LQSKYNIGVMECLLGLIEKRNELLNNIFFQSKVDDIANQLC